MNPFNRFVQQSLLYRRVSTKKQLKQEYKSQLASIKTVCPEFSLTRANCADFKECISGYSVIEKRMATKLGSALRHLKRNLSMIMIVSDADRIARRSDVFETVQAQGLGHRIFDVSTGNSVNEIIAIGEHYRIERQYKAARMSCQGGIQKRIAAGGSMGNPNIQNFKRQAAKIKKQNDQQRKDAVLMAVAQQSMKSRGKPTCLKAISDALDKKEVRTGQSLPFTPKRLSQFKKLNSGLWRDAANKYHSWLRRLKRTKRCAKIEFLTLH